MENAPENESEEIRNFQTSRVIAIFDDEAQAQSAYEALTANKFNSDTAELFRGIGGELEMDPKGEHHEYLAEAKRKLHHVLQPEASQMDHYADELLAGRYVIQVQTDYGNWEAAHEILKSSGGHFINFYGLLTSKVLEP